jgi:glycosyltransferase involved in cell wall biosynthesis
MSATTPEVDVVIPVYNGARFVGEAIASALGQSYEGAITVWCIDDGSTDDSLAALGAAAAQDGRVRVLRNATNRGVAATRNRGIRESAAGLIGFLDQDDCWLPHKLERQVAALGGDPSLGYVTGLQLIELLAGERPPRWTRPEWFEHPQPGNLPSALLVRRRVFEEVGLFDEAMTHGGDDVDWFARTRRRGVPHQMLDEPVVTRRIHSANNSALTTEGDLLASVRRHLSEPGATG